MEIFKDSSQHPEIIRIKGELDHSAWETFSPLIQEILMRKIPKIHLDLQEIHNATSEGLSILELLEMILTWRGGVLILLNPPAFLKSHLTRFTIREHP